MLKLPTDWLQGQSLLHLAVLGSSPDIVEVLLKHGVDVNMSDLMVSCEMLIKRQGYLIHTSHLTVAAVGAHTASSGCRKGFFVHCGTVIEA